MGKENALPYQMVQERGRDTLISDFHSYRTFAFDNSGYRPPAWLEHAVEDSIMARLPGTRAYLKQERGPPAILRTRQKQRKVWQRSFNARGVPTFRPDTFQREALLILKLSIRDPKVDRVVARILRKFPPSCYSVQTDRVAEFPVYGSWSMFVCGLRPAAHVSVDKRSRSCGASTWSMVGPMGTMPVGFTCNWLP